MQPVNAVGIPRLQAREDVNVYHDAKDQQTIDFRPDQPNLLARIEQEIPMLAQELGKH